MKKKTIAALGIGTLVITSIGATQYEDSKNEKITDKLITKEVSLDTKIQDSLEDFQKKASNEGNKVIYSQLGC